MIVLSPMHAYTLPGDGRFLLSALAAASDAALQPELAPLWHWEWSASREEVLEGVSLSPH